jgi:MoaA/NifB/PqqE/SkfB family radical SAM enzyme
LFRERDVIKLIKIGWDQVQISVDGPNARIQNYLRQARGAFQKAVRTARLFTLWKKRLKSDKPYLGFNTVLTRLVFDKMDEMIRLAAEVGSQLVYVEPLYPGYLKGERLELNEDEKRKFKKCIGKVMKLAKELGVSTNIDHFLEIELVDKSSFEQTVLKQVEKLSPTLLHAPCYQPWYLMGIKGSGLTGCCSTFETGEWIQNKSLEEIWFGPFFDRIREKMIKRELPSYCSKCSVVVVMDNRKLRKQLLKSVAV